MYEELFPSHGQIVLLLLSFLFCALRAGHDGLSDAGVFYHGRQNLSTFSTVGWWPWHLLNWAGRDLFVALLYLRLALAGTSWLIIMIAVVLNYLVHDYFYWLFYANRKHFAWGLEGFKFPSFFRKIFMGKKNRMHT